MSAFICPPEHIAILAIYAARTHNLNCVIYEDRLNNNLSDQAQAVAKRLMQANVDSVNYRYKEANDAELIMQAETMVVKLRRRPALTTKLKTLDILAMLNCYEYQACEHPEYQTSLAKKQVAWIRNSAIHQLPGYEKAINTFYLEKGQL